MDMEGQTTFSFHLGSCFRIKLRNLPYIIITCDLRLPDRR